MTTLVNCAPGRIIRGRLIGISHRCTRIEKDGETGTGDNRSVFRQLFQARNPQFMSVVQASRIRLTARYRARSLSGLFGHDVARLHARYENHVWYAATFGP